jgi:hypothetical protein
MSAPVNIIAYESRIGTMAAYATIWRFVGDLAEEEAGRVITLSQNHLIAGPIHFDNTQTHMVQQDPRIGHKNKMTLRLGATWVAHHY